MWSLFFQDTWKVLLWSLLLGAGLPVVYALGVRALAIGTDGSGAEVGRSPLGRGLAVFCFFVVLAGTALGLLYIVAAGKGEQLSFSNGYPTFVPKS